MASQTQINVAFFDAQTDEEITMLNKVESTYAKVSFTSTEEDNVIVICAAYDSKDNFSGIKLLEIVSTATEYTTPIITLDGEYTLKLFVWNNLGKMIPLCGEAVLTHADTVTLTLSDCDDAGETDYITGTEVTLVTPVKSAKGGKYTFSNWSDGTKTYSAGDKIKLTENLTLTAQWNYESFGVVNMEFDEKSLIKAGPYDSATATYDNTIIEVTKNVTGVQSVNVRKTASSAKRRYVYATIDLTNEKKAEQVLLNILASRSGTAQGNYIYVDIVDKVPEVGESNPEKTGQATSLKLTNAVNDTLQELDITEAYNNAIGSELCLKIYGWAYTDSKAYNYVKLNTDTLKLDVTPYVEGKYTVTFDKGAEPIYADIDSEITLPEYSIVIPGEKFTGWSDGTTTYQSGDTYKVTKTTRFTATIVDDPDSMTEAQKLLDGKKIIFVGNSFIYYGRTVKTVSSDYCQQSKRINDTGGFYQLCKKNYIDVEVTNWTFGGHKLGDLFGAVCTYSGCPCNENSEIHEDYITDKYYDYVVVSPGSGERQSNEFLENIEYITDFFQEANPDVKIIILGNTAGHGVGKELTTITSNYKTLYNEGYPIADWGYLVKNIIDGTETVEGATQVYNKNTFIVKDGYHPNLLSGYITTLFTYCTITGEKALGQPYEYLLDSTTAPADVAAFVEKYYTNGDADTTFPEILNSEADIRGIQKLIDKYIEEKAYLTKY